MAKTPPPELVFGPYRARPIRFLGLWDPPGFRLKAYSIAARSDLARDELIVAARQAIGRRLREQPTRHAHYGVGFVGIHDGHGENQVFLDRWINENELLHDYWVSNTDRPGELRTADADHNAVCVWDLAVQCFERRAWIDCVLDNPDGPDLDAYLARRMHDA